MALTFTYTETRTHRITVDRDVYIPAVGVADRLLDGECDLNDPRVISWEKEESTFQLEGWKKAEPTKPAQEQ